jgi:hypothetical protein
MIDVGWFWNVDSTTWNNADHFIPGNLVANQYEMGYS